MLIEQIIGGTVYPELQKQLQAEDKKMILEKVIQMVKKHEASTIWDNYNPQETKTYNPIPQLIAYKTPTKTDAIQNV